MVPFGFSTNQLLARTVLATVGLNTIIAIGALADTEDRSDMPSFDGAGVMTFPLVTSITLRRAPGCVKDQLCTYKVYSEITQSSLYGFQKLGPNIEVQIENRLIERDIPCNHSRKVTDYVFSHEKFELTVGYSVITTFDENCYETGQLADGNVTILTTVSTHDTFKIKRLHALSEQ